MEQGPVDTERLIQDHQRILKDIGRLGNIASELDELGSIYTVEVWASRAEKQPSMLLSQLVELLASFSEGLRKHFTREEEHLPQLARKYNAGQIAASLMAEHKEMLRIMHALTEQAVELSVSKAPASQKQSQVLEFSSTLKSLLAMLSGHAEKEDEVLFIIDHNA